MPSLDQLEAFAAAARQGSFSAAARHLGRAQSAISTAIINLEIETDTELFDRSSRSPRLTAAGQALLGYATTVLQSYQEFMAHANTLAHVAETRICLAIEQSISLHRLLPVMSEFEQQFPFVTLEILDPGSSDVATLIRDNRADLGLMMEQEDYPRGFNFQGVGYSRVLPVCRHDHPLVRQQPVTQAELRCHRQLVIRSRDLEHRDHERHTLSPRTWLSESPYLIMELLCAGIGWAFLHEAVIQEKLGSGELAVLDMANLKTDILQGVDVVWTENRSLGTAGQWLLQELLAADLDSRGQS